MLAEDLVDAVKTEWKKAQDALNQGIGGYGGAPGYAHGQYQHQQPHGQQPHGQQPQGQQQQWQQWDQAGYGQPQPPMPDGQPPPPPPPEDEAPRESANLSSSSFVALTVLCASHSPAAR